MHSARMAESQPCMIKHQHTNKVFIFNVNGKVWKALPGNIPILEKALGQLKGGVFAVGVDTNGYLTSHNLKFPQALTADEQKDLVGNRTRRKFDSPNELRSARKQTPPLLQTCARDTGELISELAMPVMIGGRHWGNVRVGCTTETLLA